MSEALPARIVAHLEALGQALAEVARAHRDGTLATLEAATLTAILAAMPGLLGAVLTEGTTSLQPGGVGRTQVCPGCGARCRVAGWLIDLGASTSFADAGRGLGKLTGLAISAETIRQHTDERGIELEAARTVQATREAVEPLDRAPGALVVEIDGVMVR